MCRVCIHVPVSGTCDNCLLLFEITQTAYWVFLILSGKKAEHKLDGSNLYKLLVGIAYEICMAR